MRGIPTPEPANAHRKAIYAKLGGHTQQEPLTTVEETRGGE